VSWLSALLGLDASHNAGVAQKNATTFANQAAPGYQGLLAAGQGVSTPGSQSIVDLMNTIKTQAGIVETPAGATGAQIAPHVPQAGPTLGGTYGAQKDAYQQQQEATTAAANQSPYKLSEPQQQQLNQHIDAINVMARRDAAQLQENLRARGIDDPRALEAGMEQLQLHYSQLATQTSTDFYNKIANDKEAIAAQLAQMEIGLTEAGAGGLASLGGAQSNIALQQNQLAASQQGGLLNLVGFAAGGGFQPAKPAQNIFNFPGSAPSGGGDPTAAAVGAFGGPVSGAFNAPSSTPAWMGWEF